MDQVSRSRSRRADTFEIQPDGREALQLSAGLWIGSLAMVSASSIITGNVRYFGEYLSLLTGLTSAVAIAYLMFLAMKALGGRPKWQAYLVMPILVVIAGFTQMFAENVLYFLLQAMFDNTRVPPQDLASQLMVTFMYACLYATNMALLWVTSANRAMRTQADRLARAEADGLRSELNALRLKLNPHFMFNALASASGLVEAHRHDEGVQMLDRLSSFLRTSYDVGLGDISLDEELSVVGDYLEVERVRFPDRLRVLIDVEDGLEEARVPSLLLQPLVENAVKYAVAPSSTPVQIAIVARRAGDRLHLAVTNSAPTISRPVPSGTGVGQAATRSRLEIRYGGRAHFTSAPDAGGYHVQIDLPLDHTQETHATTLSTVM